MQAEEPKSRLIEKQRVKQASSMSSIWKLMTRHINMFDEIRYCMVVDMHISNNLAYSV